MAAGSAIHFAYRTAYSPVGGLPGAERNPVWVHVNGVVRITLCASLCNVNGFGQLGSGLSYAPAGLASRSPKPTFPAKASGGHPRPPVDTDRLGRRRTVGPDPAPGGAIPRPTPPARPVTVAADGAVPVDAHGSRLNVTSLTAGVRTTGPRGFGSCARAALQAFSQMPRSNSAK